MAEEGGAPKKKVPLTFAGKYIILNLKILSTQNRIVYLIELVQIEINY